MAAGGDGTRRAYDLRTTSITRQVDGKRSARVYASAMDQQPRAPSGRPPTADAVIAACLVLLGLVEVSTTPGIQRGLAVPLVTIAAAALAWRRRAPLVTVGVVIGVTTLTSLIAAPIDSLNMVIPILALAIYSLGAHATTRRAVAGLGLCIVGVWISTFANEGPGGDNLLFGLIVAGGPWLAGWMVRRRTQQAVALALRAQALEQSQTERERTAVADERDRIARELHDIIAHSVSVMTIQAGAIEEVLDREPEKARAAAASIRQTGRDALIDLRRLLGLLRDDDPVDARTLAPQPGLADIDDLLEAVRRSGLDVRFTVDGTPLTLPPGLDLSAFRVVQEALTNTLKHARASVASVGVRYGSDAVDIEVVDDGHATGASVGGHGLVGMRERVALYGGDLEYGTLDAGGFRVYAQLPLDGSSG
jgi:signal transduction histidine kinase